MEKRMIAVSTTEELSKKLQEMNFRPEQLQILGDIADALVRPVGGGPYLHDPILSNHSFWYYFANVLLVHHATNDEKFKKKAFEFAFRNACRAEGLDAEITASQTNPGADIVVSGTKFSLKTEADQKISTKYIKISKLMEARWIRDAAPTDRRGEIARLRVLEHLEQYDRVITLRAFDVLERGTKTHVRYQLWEIPVENLRGIERLSPLNFSIPTSNNSYSAEVRASADPYSDKMFSLRMDGSVEKITVASLDIKYCILHAEWIIPVDRPTSNDED